MGLATCGSSSRQHRALCPLLSWQLAVGSWEQAGPHPSRPGQAGPLSGQGGDKADGASLGLVLPKMEG